MRAHNVVGQDLKTLLINANRLEKAPQVMTIVGIGVIVDICKCQKQHE